MMCRGRVLVYHPHTHKTHVVASGFYYSDGVALSDDGSYLLVVETDALRVVKVWLQGSKVGGKARRQRVAHKQNSVRSHTQPQWEL